MKKIALLTATLLMIFSCKNENKMTKEEINQPKYTKVGMPINDTDALPTSRMLVHYEAMNAGDSIHSKMKGNIVNVCQNKGCWMTLDMGQDQTVMVKFKDYGFFVPTDAKGEVVVNGLAFVEETPVDELRHYAKDAGKSEEEIEAITTPKRTYKFEADGVLLKN